MWVQQERHIPGIERAWGSDPPVDIYHLRQHTALLEGWSYGEVAPAAHHWAGVHEHGRLGWAALAALAGRAADKVVDWTVEGIGWAPVGMKVEVGQKLGMAHHVGRRQARWQVEADAT